MDTQFSRVFSKQLVSELVSREVDLQFSPVSNALQIEIEVDAIIHPDDRDGSRISWSAAFANAWLIGSLKSRAVYGLAPTAIGADVTAHN